MQKAAIIEAGQGVVDNLRDLEIHLDSSVESIARLMGSMMEAKRAGQLPLATGQQALAQFTDAAYRMVAVRGVIIDGHAELAKTRDSFPHLRHMSYGDWSDCPKPSSLGDGAPVLHAVAG